MKGNRRRATNAIEVHFLTRTIFFGFLIGFAALFFVYIKNQQHSVGNESRQVEAELHEYTARNEALMANITKLTSRGYLQRKLDEGYIHLSAVRDSSMESTNPAIIAQPDGLLRTASRDNAEASRRVLSR
jgi:cell division protein FtsB